MLSCPTCSFPVETEWSACRRCGLPLPPELRDAAIQPARASALPLVRPARSALQPSVPPVNDTLLPGGHAPTGPDTLLPKSSGAPASSSGIERTKAAMALALERLRRYKPGPSSSAQGELPK
jgi:hypothetical protein